MDSSIVAMAIGGPALSREGGSAVDIVSAENFGPNPGNLRMMLGMPSTATALRPLVVALHGCTQTAEGFAVAAGWMRLAKAHDFLLLLPEQKRENNPQTCFRWYEQGETRRGSGEVASIQAMIATAIRGFGADPRRVFITGLSAGGAMAGAMLATYPEVFAAGTIVAGLPFGTATSVAGAFESMTSGKVKEPKAWGDIVRAASANTGPWPAISIWHGTADKVVKPINAGELVKQWTNIHGVSAERPTEDRVGDAVRRVWRNGSQRASVTEYSIPGMGHGVAIEGKTPPAPFFLPAGIDSSEQICRDWGLIQNDKGDVSLKVGMRR